MLWKHKIRFLIIKKRKHNIWTWSIQNKLHALISLRLNIKNKNFALHLEIAMNCSWLELWMTYYFVVMFWPCSHSTIQYASPAHSFFLFCSQLLKFFSLHLQMPSETYSCLIRLKSLPEEDAIRMQPGSGDTHVLYVLFLAPAFVLCTSKIVWEWCLWLYSFPDSIGDDLLLEVQDSKGKQFGRVHVQLATIADDPVIFLGPDIGSSLNFVQVEV